MITVKRATISSPAMSVSLWGPSRRVPPMALGGEVAWLLPLDSDSITLLVERPGR
jgi:hypothetical protein